MAKIFGFGFFFGTMIIMRFFGIYQYHHRQHSIFLLHLWREFFLSCFTYFDCFCYHHHLAAQTVPVASERKQMEESGDEMGEIK